MGMKKQKLNSCKQNVERNEPNEEKQTNKMNVWTFWLASTNYCMWHYLLFLLFLLDLLYLPQPKVLVIFTDDSDIDFITTICLSVTYLILYFFYILFYYIFFRFSNITFTRTPTRREFDNTDTPKMKKMNKEAVGGISMHSFYIRFDLT